MTGHATVHPRHSPGKAGFGRGRIPRLNLPVASFAGDAARYRMPPVREEHVPRKPGGGFPRGRRRLDGTVAESTELDRRKAGPGLDIGLKVTGPTGNPQTRVLPMGKGRICPRRWDGARWRTLFQTGRCPQASQATQDEGQRRSTQNPGRPKLFGFHRDRLSKNARMSSTSSDDSRSFHAGIGIGSGPRGSRWPAGLPFQIKFRRLSY